MAKKWTLLNMILIMAVLSGFAQNTPYYHLRGYMPATWVNPAIPLEKTINISIASVNVGLNTDGVAIQDLTSKNSEGNRYIDLKKIENFKRGKYDIYVDNDIRTIDAALKLGSFAIMAGHGFRSSANIGYNTDLIQLLAYGNAPFIGKTLDIGPSVDVLAYNELYLGLQKQFGALTLGGKAKLLYGTSALYTESSTMQFTTLDEYYQLQFNNEYLIRSSSLFKYQALDDVTVDYSGFTFDNFFYNNRGFAFDLGAHYQATDQLSLSASLLDVGSITWDFSPRKYESKGSFTFEGVDIINFIEDSTLSVKDTLLDLIDVTSSTEAFKTQLNRRLLIGGSYVMDTWSFEALYQMHRRYGKDWHQLSLAAYKRISFLDLGLLYTIHKNDFSSVGLYGGIKLKPLQLYVAADNIIRVFSYERAKNARVTAGLTIRF
ncbi:MAG: DUF5723 family protein [Chitinophagales bacterium]|nr:DUF5723 family protein [Chitinophagales bacterium]